MAAAQSFLSNLTNTGVGPGGVLLADAVVDPYYSLPPTAVPGGMPADYFGNAVAVSDICHATGTACAYLNSYVKYTCYEYTPWSLPPDAAYTSGRVEVDRSRLYEQRLLPRGRLHLYAELRSARRL